MNKKFFAVALSTFCFLSEAGEAVKGGTMAVSAFKEMNRTVRVVFPAMGPKSDEHLRVSLAQLESGGLQYVCDDPLDTAASPFGKYANTHESRGASFISALRGQEDILWGFTGGSGSLEVLDIVEREGGALESPKVLIGFSDMTSLHGYWTSKGWPAFHGSLVGLSKVADPVSKVGLNAETRLDPIIQILTGETKQVTYDFEIIHRGNLGDDALVEAEKGVAGGNMMVMSEMKGTSIEINGKGRFIFMEDVESDATYALRKLMGLHRSGLFKDASALIFGDIFLGVEDHQTLTRDVLRKFVEFTNLDVPVVYSTGFGHGAVNNVMPFNFPSSLRVGAESAKLCVDFT